MSPAPVSPPRMATHFVLEEYAPDVARDHCDVLTRHPVGNPTQEHPDAVDLQRPITRGRNRRLLQQ